MGDGNDVRRNRFVERLSAGEVPVGAWMICGDIHTARRVGDSELDFVVIDMEHEGFDFPALGNTLQWLLSPRACRRGRFVVSPAPIVRVSADAGERNDWLIKQALDYGAFGVIVPRVQSRADAEAAVRAARYSRGPDGPEPRGHRGMSPLVAMRYWGCSGFPEYFEKAELWPLSPDGEVVVLGMIEDKVGFDNIEEIVTTPGLAGLVFGHGDGSLSLGAETAMGLPSFAPIWEARSRVLDACLAAKMPLGPVVSTTDEYHAAVAAGFHHISTPADGMHAFAEILAAPRAKHD
jgi:4-hydroxy-2-oxoheptanedioate aldolase